MCCLYKLLQLGSNGVKQSASFSIGDQRVKVTFEHDIWEALLLFLSLVNQVIKSIKRGRSSDQV